MNTKAIALAAVTVLTIGLPLFPAVRKVRVTADRAVIYVGPNRTSTRIDLVRKGDLLDLFQQSKVNSVWYYVRYVSPRYGSQISGFIQDSAVELEAEGEPAGQKAPPASVKVEAGSKPMGNQPRVQPAPATAAVQPPPEQKKPEPKSPPAPEIAASKPKPIERSEVLGTTPLPRSRRVSAPRRAPEPQDRPWAILEPSVPVTAKPAPGAAAAPPPPEQKKPEPKSPLLPEPAGQKPKTIERSEVLGTTPLSRSRRVSLPRRAAVPQDRPWAILKPAVPEYVKPAPSPGAIPQPPAPSSSKAPAEKPAGAASKPVVLEPAAPRPVAPSSPPTQIIKPAQPRETRRGPSTLAIGLGFGSSYGGAGACLRLNLSSRLALHGGFGLYPTGLVYSATNWVKNETLWSAGIRYSPPVGSGSISPYIDLQYGGLRVEAAQVVTGIFEFAYVYRHEQKTLWGPSLLAGLEIRLGRLGIEAGLGVSYNLTDWEFLKQRLALAFEAGLSFRL
jgi:hypothetical protein